MASHRHADSTLIDTVGTKNVRDAFRLTSQALHMWRVRGVPLASKIAFAKLCADHGVGVPADFFNGFRKLSTEEAA
jgi:hypothetical protein